ncbi:DNA-processing protein DprA [Streptomyces sp. NEAU-W12]|uniref:DNA-processing protein DprA n=1 Tax=Streptomyces sp. NEAU-W12 TaxID=2994668 RepID=UPI00224B034F|nr:DNA-processing protein DprA [Streptomyces sp. NEAU-W12]MCX2927286.1 DNA-processing protein DprA [Streptomyces sp. NEAU-W12]
MAETADREREGTRSVTVLDEGPPLFLRPAHRRPPFLFPRGTPVEDDLRVACVGPRTPTPEGAAPARAIAGGPAERRVTRGSGLAAGTGTAAHVAALLVGGPDEVFRHLGPLATATGGPTWALSPWQRETADAPLPGRGSLGTRRRVEGPAADGIVPRELIALAEVCDGAAQTADRRICRETVPRLPCGHSAVALRSDHL